MQNIKGNIEFENKPAVISCATTAGQKESEGPLGSSFDRVFHDCYAGKDTFEQAESEMLYTAARIALDKGELSADSVDIAFCGDLLNQCVASSFAMRPFPTPYAGVYGACSTMALSLILSAMSVDSGAANRAMCGASSHYCTAERQYRFPLEYGSQRPPTAQWTVTGAGVCILGNADKNPDISRENAVDQADKRGYLPRIVSARIGRITDYGISDQNNMGAAMAPAAADTIYAYLANTNTEPYDYDMIFTGDLGRVGSRLLYDLMMDKGVDLGTRHSDCGVMIFGEDQDVHAGGSGCGCCASVLCGHILESMRKGIYKNILFVATGALLSPTTVLQKETIPSIAHLVHFRVC